MLPNFKTKKLNDINRAPQNTKNSILWNNPLILKFTASDGLVKVRITRILKSQHLFKSNLL